MKANIIVSFDGITPGELETTLQGLRNVEQGDSKRIQMMIITSAPELNMREMTELLQRIDPPLPYTFAAKKGRESPSV